MMVVVVDVDYVVVVGVVMVGVVVVVFDWMQCW